MKDPIERQVAFDALIRNKEIYSDNSDPLDRYAVAIIDGDAQTIAQLPSARPDQNIVDDLISFIEKEKGKENRTLSDWVVRWILEKIIDGECKITGSATDHTEKKMYVEFTFYQGGI